MRIFLFMKQKPKKILIGLSVILIVLFIGAYIRLPSKEVKSVPNNSNSIEGVIKKEPITTTLNKNTSAPKLDIEINKIPEATIKVTIIVGDKSYDTDILNNSNIYDLMMLMSNSKNSDFTFHAKEYRGMGYFVDMINDVYGSPGAYWIYYINNEKASVGISQYTLKDGDIIRWVQEGLMNN